MDYHAYRKHLLQKFPEPTLAFEPREYDRRLSCVRQAMEESGLDVLVLTDVNELCYLTGYTTFEVSVQCVLLVSAASTVLFVPAIEVGPAVHLSRVDEVVGYPWQSPDALVQALVQQIHKLSDSTTPRLGYDAWSGSFRPGLFVSLQSRLDDAQWVDAASLVSRVSLVKSPEELAYLSESAEMTRLGLDAAETVIRPGVKDHQIAQAGANAMLAAGSEFMSMQPIVTTGWRSGVIHTNHAGYTVERGDVVFLEFGAVRRRYTAPMMRTVVVGEASPEVREFHQVALDVLEAVMSAAKAGNTFADAALAGQTALKPIENSAFFSGVFGYPVGAAFPPSWVAGDSFIAADNSSLLVNDMVFHLPICLRKPGAFGVGFSETVRITDGGARPITSNHFKLREIVDRG